MIRFSKYHGCGNDFVIMTAEEAGGRPYPELAKRICHRQLGVGADGLIIVRREPLEMVYYNSDGSRAPMCGNGIRCFANYCFEEGICTENAYPVKTLAGTMEIKVTGTEPFLAEVGMGKPDVDPKRCGIATEQSSFLKQKLQLKKGQIEVSSCFMGTIHTVVWMDMLVGIGTETLEDGGLRSVDVTDPEDPRISDLEKLGEEISSHPVFAEKTNVNFVQVLSPTVLKLRTYERGAGMTFACGTGACASVVIGALEGRCIREARVILPYGHLDITQKTDDEVMMTGPAVKIAQGYFEE